MKNRGELPHASESVSSVSLSITQPQKQSIYPPTISVYYASENPNYQIHNPKHWRYTGGTHHPYVHNTRGRCTPCTTVACATSRMPLKSQTYEELTFDPEPLAALQRISPPTQSRSTAQKLEPLEPFWIQTHF